MAKIKVKRKAPTPAPAPPPAQRSAAIPAGVATASISSLNPRDQIPPDAIAYKLWVAWWLARARGDYMFLYDLTSDGSQAREHFGPRETFTETCSRKLRRVHGTEPGQLVKILLRGPDHAEIFQALDLKARERREYDLERWTLHRAEAGWEIHRIDRTTVTRDIAPTVAADRMAVA